jgi:transcriptional regulator with XRE-family HTH domain
MTVTLPNSAQRAALRHVGGMTQRDVAASLGVSQATIALWELGLRSPSKRYRDRYAQLLQELRDEADLACPHCNGTGIAGVE